MKAHHIIRALGFLAGAITTATVSLRPMPCVAQSPISFNNRIVNVVIAPIYGLEPSDPKLCKSGNTPAGYPPGTQTYSGPLLAGSGYTAELWFGPEGVPEEALIALSPGTTFQPPGPSSGFIIPVTVLAPPLVPPGSAIILQMRVWDNRGGTVASWAMANADPTVPKGKSPLWVAVMPSGPTPSTSPMAGLRSFNLCVLAQPPTILTNPVSQVVSPGAPVTFSVTATGEATLHYQWWFTNSAILDGTNSSYYIPHAGPEHVGSYFVTVTDTFGATTSQPATLALLGLQVCAVLTLDGAVGAKYRIEYSPEMVEPPVWTPLETVTLTTNPYYYIDWASPGTPKRYYRAVPVP